MSDGISRQRLAGRVLLVLLLSMLAGCSTWFARPPAPQPEQPPPEPAPAEEAPPAPASEPLASAPIAAAPPQEAPEHKHVTPRPIYRPPPKPHPAPPPAAARPAAPPPLITTRALAPNDAHGLLDARVQRPDGKVIGRAIDMFVDAAGKPREMLVNLAGFMGIGDRKMRFPWTDFRFDATQRKAPITLAIPPGEPPAAASSHAKDKATGNSGGAGANDARLLGVIDATAERGNGARVGRVVDVLIDNRGEPQAAVVDVGSLIHERRSIAADWSALRFVPKDNALSLQTDLSDAQVNAAPPYAPNQPVRAVAPAAADAAASAGHPTR
ncbi:PRC-barrel domain containing protein [Trinickia acidisoli]|uniref:PRC-barrel domain containing protein n=1 Tax=Trinickia acidisoli TaxID=2767482 RepID=UPI001A8F1DF9|nr:PRC-barrel domain containing protein [Trinickia acidisoli]